MPVGGAAVFSLSSRGTSGERGFLCSVSYGFFSKPEEGGVAGGLELKAFLKTNRERAGKIHRAALGESDPPAGLQADPYGPQVNQIGDTDLGLELTMNSAHNTRIAEATAQRLQGALKLSFYALDPYGFLKCALKPSQHANLAGGDIVADLDQGLEFRAGRVVLMACVIGPDLHLRRPIMCGIVGG